MHSPRLHRHGEGESCYDGDDVAMHAMYGGDFFSDLVFLYCTG